jgi:hypothetical protein
MDVIGSQFMGEQGPFYALETVNANRRFVEAHEPLRYDAVGRKFRVRIEGDQLLILYQDYDFSAWERTLL